MEQELYKLGISMNKSGYKYLISSFSILNNNEDLIYHPNQLYKLIGLEYNTSYKVVERTLNYLFKKSYMSQCSTSNNLTYCYRLLKSKGKI